MTSVACLGLISVDLVFDVAATPKTGHKHRAEASEMLPGGGALLAATAVSGLGGEAHLAGAVGDDQLAEFLRQALDQRGVAHRMVVSRRGVPTSRSAILVTPDGERTIINHRDAGLFAAGAAEPEPPSPFPFDAVLTDTRWPRAAERLLLAARRAGRPGVVDVEAPLDGTDAMLAAASHAAFSEQGLTAFAGGADADALLRAAARLDAWVCVTRGSAPVLCVENGQVREIAGFPVTPVDTLGAGDVWHGAFALALGAGQAEGEAVRRANAAAALHVASPKQKRWRLTGAEVDAFLSERAR